MRAAALASVALVFVAACQGSALDVGASCTRAAECATGTCAFGRCRPGCEENRDCPSGASCLIDESGVGACSVAVDLGCETGIGRACAEGLVCVGDRCERRCTSAAECPSDGQCLPASSGGVSFCFDPRGEPDAGVPPDAAVDAGDASAADGGAGCAIRSMCFQRSGSACALDCVGRVWCWGAQHGGRLGNGHDEDVHVTTPVLAVDPALDPLTDVDSLACGDGASCVHVASSSSTANAGHVLCWGYDAGGGFGPLALTAVDLQPEVVGDAITVSGASSHFCLVDHTSGEVTCFGRNDALIDPFGADTTPYAAPTAPAGGVGHVATIGIANWGACAIGTDTRVRCWGDNDVGQAGGFPIDSVTGVEPNVGVTTLETAPGVALDHVVQLAVGQDMRAALVDPGDGTTTLWTWGSNARGQLGERTTWAGEACDDALGRGPTCRAHVQAPGGPVFSRIASDGGAIVTCGIVAATGHVICFGDNLSAHAGVAGGGTNVLSTRVAVQIEGGAGAELDQAVDVFVGQSNACAIRRDGSLWCWGPNADAQLARPADAGEHLAVPITFPFP